MNMKIKIKNEEKDANVENTKPLGLYYVIYEQRIRKCLFENLPNNIIMINDLNDTLSYQNAVNKSKEIFFTNVSQ